MSWEQGWRHQHYCVCGRTVDCFNPSCAEPERCPECVDQDGMIALAQRIIRAVERLRTKTYEIPSKAIAEHWRKS